MGYGNTVDLRALFLGCVLEAGGFEVGYEDPSRPRVIRSEAETALVFFFTRLLTRLQDMGTAPAIDIMAYAAWMEKEKRPMGRIEEDEEQDDGDRSRRMVRRVGWNEVTG